MSPEEGTRVQDKQVGQPQQGTLGLHPDAVGDTILSDDSRVDSPEDSLSSFPVEVLEAIFDALLVDDAGRSALIALAQTCSKYEWLTRSRLHERIIIACEGDRMAISNFVRRLRPYLTSAQLKTLNAGGESGLPPASSLPIPGRHSLPQCAELVREAFIGLALVPHELQDIAWRCVDEVFQNMTKLEVIDTRIISSSMIRAMVWMKNLKALRLHLEAVPDDVLGAAASIKGLTHFSYRCACGRDPECQVAGDLISSIILNSASTLQTLEVDGANDPINFLVDWSRIVAPEKAIWRGAMRLKALRSLSLQSLWLFEDFIDLLVRVIPFTRLDELIIGWPLRNEEIFLERLADLFTSEQAKLDGIRLRNLRMEVGCTGAASDEGLSIRNARQHFLQSFDTLTTLEYRVHNTQSKDSRELSASILDAVLKHQKLQRLEIYHLPSDDCDKLPWPNPLQLARLMHGLCHLEEFEFVPEPQFEEIGRRLLISKSLRFVKCRLAEGGTGTRTIDEIMKGILSLDDDRSGRAETYLALQKSNLTRVMVEYEAEEFDPSIGGGIAWRIVESTSWDIRSRRSKTKVSGEHGVAEHGDQERECFRHDVYRERISRTNGVRRRFDNLRGSMRKRA